MALRFSCGFCGNEITVRNLKVGEMALCRNCDRKVEIPDTAIEYRETPPKEPPKVQPEIPPPQEKKITNEPAKPEIESDTKETAGSVISADALRIRISSQTMENINTAYMKPLEGMAKAIIIFALLIMVMLVIAFISTVDQYVTLKAIASGKAILTISRASSLDSRQAMINYTLLPLNIAFLIIFLVWFYNAHRNLKLANVPLMKYSSGWTIGGFFVPFLNFIRPEQMMADTWSGSALIAGEYQYDPFGKRRWNRKISMWWTIFILAGIFRFEALLRSRVADTAQELISPIQMYIANEVLLFIDIIVLIYLVREITSFQSSARKLSYIKSTAK